MNTSFHDSYIKNPTVKKHSCGASCNDVGIPDFGVDSCKFKIRRLRKRLQVLPLFTVILIASLCDQVLNAETGMFV